MPVPEPQSPSSDIQAAGTTSRRHCNDVSSLCFSNSDCHNNDNHTTVGLISSGSFGIEGLSCPHNDGQESCLAADCQVDLESGELEKKNVHFEKEDRDCRICHLNLVAASGDGDGGGAVDLGCDCKGDLGAVHKHCAETWFKIKGDTICEICGTTACNIVGEQANVGGDIAPVASTTEGPIVFNEAHNNYSKGRRIINILFGFTIIAFAVSWLLHFKVFPSS